MPSFTETVTFESLFASLGVGVGSFVTFGVAVGSSSFGGSVSFGASVSFSGAFVTFGVGVGVSFGAGVDIASADHIPPS